MPLESGRWRATDDWYFSSHSRRLEPMRSWGHSRMTEDIKIQGYSSLLYISSVQSLSRVRLCDPMDCSTPGLPVITNSQSLLKLMSIELVMPSNHLILCHPLLLLLSIFPSIRDFSNELSVRIRWPKYWSVSFSISPSSEYSGLISFRIDWFDLCAV